MTEGSGTRLRCPGCNYATRVWDDDGHVKVCPECQLDGLMPYKAAQQVQMNRMQAAPDTEIDRLVWGDYGDLLNIPASRVDSLSVEREYHSDVALLSLDATFDGDRIDALEQMVAQVREHGPDPSGFQGDGRTEVPDSYDRIPFSDVDFTEQWELDQGENDG